MALFGQKILPDALRATFLPAGDEESSINPWVFAAAVACGTWYMFILGVQAIGFTQLCV